MLQNGKPALFVGAPTQDFRIRATTQDLLDATVPRLPLCHVFESRQTLDVGESWHQTSFEQALCTARLC